MRISTNVAALNTHRVLAGSDRAAGRSLERLASGLRLNRAADDAAELAVAEGLRSRIGGMRQAVRNTHDGISVVRTAEGALAQSTSVLQRMRDLTVQAANDGALDASAKAAVQREIDQLAAELTRIATVTAFNGTPLLDGSYRGTFQVGSEVGETLTVVIGGAGRGMDAEGLGIGGIDVARTAAVSAARATATPAVSDEEGVPTSGRLSLAGDFITPGSLEAAYRDLTGTISYAGRTFDLGTVDYTGDVTAQDHIDTINLAARAALGTAGMPVVATSGELVFTGDNPGPGSTTADGQRLSLRYDPQLDTGTAVRALDTAIRRVGSARADLGAIENRLAHTAARLDVAVENTTASWSRIRDTDMAAEMSTLTRAQVLSQAGTAMLAQAQQSPQGILRLLG
ncbi:flagellin [Blastococcus sp. DSM 46786]|uniref:flagellin N-terminal helical domain-containing protein n=1 Tax=Blastococcus sp. DSM 46786 TaxID=1798227 RepID=UPI0008D50362|nr:flagellin [Blastococcus sp. DSM 46786]SEL46023.1 flagellin [Blastococcus sp. DSM 46786]